MKKTLIALAAVAVTSTAFAQNVTISGNLNINAIDNGKVTFDEGRKTDSERFKTSNTGRDNGWTASEIRLSGSEDLGGGLTASFAWGTGIGDGFSGRDRFLQLGTADMGSVRIGRFIPTSTMGFHGFSGARTAANGSMYGFGVASPIDFANNNINPSNAAFYGDDMGGGNFERNNNRIQYSSPDFGGLTFSVNYANRSNDTAHEEKTKDLAGKNSTRDTGFGIAYTTGALSLAAGMNDRKQRTEGALAKKAVTGACLDSAGTDVAAVGTDGKCATGATLLRAAVKAAKATDETRAKTDLDWIGASYDFGVAKVSATHVKRKSTETVDGERFQLDKISATGVGVSVPLGSFTVAASMYSGKNKQSDVLESEDDLKLSGHQLSVTYSMSKRTTVYAFTGQNKAARTGDNETSGNRKLKSTQVGIMHAF